ncbi:MAG: molecular chaperone [Nitrospinota bacterium]
MGAVIGDRDLSRLRREHYAVLAQIFMAGPTGELLEALSGDILARSRGAAQMDLTLAEGWRALRDLFQDGGPPAWVQRCDDEYMRLFVGPGVPEATPSESYYRTGKVYDEPLAWVREFMEEVGLERAGEISDSEDHIAFEFEIMRYLISKQEAAPDPDGESKWLDLQGKFLRRHLATWAPNFFLELEGKESAPFYGAMAKVGRGFLAWEGRILARFGPPAEEAALRPLASRGGWKGPLFDPKPPGTTPESPEGRKNE